MKAPIGPGTPVCIGGSPQRIHSRPYRHSRPASIIVPSMLIRLLDNILTARGHYFLRISSNLYGVFDFNAFFNNLFDSSG